MDPAAAYGASVGMRQPLWRNWGERLHLFVAFCLDVRTLTQKATKIWFSVSQAAFGWWLGRAAPHCFHVGVIVGTLGSGFLIRTWKNVV